MVYTEKRIRKEGVDLNLENKKEKLLELLQNKEFAKVRREVEEENPVDIADLIESMEKDNRILTMRLLPKDLAVDVFAEMEPDLQETLLSEITTEEIDHLVKEMFVDDLVDLLEELPASLVAEILDRVHPSDRDTLNRFLQYQEDTAGSIMTSEYTSLKKSLKVPEAIDYLRKNGQDSETLYSCYVVSDSRVLLGVVTLRTLLLSEDQHTVEELMEEKVVSVHTEDDVEGVADLFSRYDFMTLPVVDKENRLVGIITVDDIMDVILEEDTEDFEKMAGTVPSDKPYLKTSVWELAKNRLGWLTFLMLSGMITGAILNTYEEAFMVIPVLVTFIPMLTDTGGNSGSQSSTLIIRGLVLGEIEMKDVFKVFVKEFEVSLMAGSVLAILTYIRLRMIYPDKPLIVVVVSLAILLTVIMAKLLGALLPFIAKKIKADPAIMAAPMITTIVDASSLLIYFYLAQLILKI